MNKRIAIYWPGEYVEQPNEMARPYAEEATRQLEKALNKLGYQPYRVEGFIDRPHKSIEMLGPIQDPMIGVHCHWVWGSHTVDGVVGKDNPLLLASNYKRELPGLVGLMNTSACLTSLGRAHSRIWTDAGDWSQDPVFMERLEAWCTTGRINYNFGGIRASAPLSAQSISLAEKIKAGINKRRILMMMLGDTSQGMINAYFGPRLLTRYGFTEHKVDQAWLLERGPSISPKRIKDALAFAESKGVAFHWGEPASDSGDFAKEHTLEQLRDYLAVLDLVDEFKADCLGWQYQIGLLNLRPPSDFAEGLLNSACRPESNGETIPCATEGDQGNTVPAELMKRLLKAKGLHHAVFMHDTRWGGEHEGRTVWMLCNSGSGGAYAYNQDPDSLKGVHSYRQIRRKFPIPGGTFTGYGLPGPITWARCFSLGAELCMDIGRGEIVDIPEPKRSEWWNGATPQWPMLTTDLGVDRDVIMANFMSNHIAFCYGDVFGPMVALCTELGFKVRIYGDHA
jgi:hypothetical protein